MGTRSRKRKRQKDLISTLPDDILVQVLSRLAQEGVIRCGALSRRWTNLPKLVPMTLKFLSKYYFKSTIEEAKFIRWVNQVIDSYPSDTVTELSISCRGCRLDQHSQFDKWVRFAMAKQVTKFSLDLTGSKRGYTYPRCHSCTSLKDLRLQCVNVTTNQIRHFLDYCPLLESLCVIGSSTLECLQVDGPIRLKFLEVQDCVGLQVFEISAPNLISFKYIQYGMKIMPPNCPPQLTELALSDYDFLTLNFHRFTSYFAQIVTLSLVADDAHTKSPEFQWPDDIPTLSSLKNLTICASRGTSESLLSFTSWIESSPLLIRFVFERRGYPLYQKREAAKTRVCPHQLLKEVEFVGFKGDIMDTELVTYIMENAVNLDKMVFDCRNPDSKKDTPSDDTESKQRSIAIDGAKRFKSMLSSRVKFVLLPQGE